MTAQRNDPFGIIQLIHSSYLFKTLTDQRIFPLIPDGGFGWNDSPPFPTPSVSARQVSETASALQRAMSQESGTSGSSFFGVRRTREEMDELVPSPPKKHMGLPGRGSPLVHGFGSSPTSLASPSDALPREGVTVKRATGRPLLLAASL